MLLQRLLVKPVRLAHLPFQAVTVDSTLEVALGNGKKHLG